MIPIYINTNFLLVPKNVSVLEACEIISIIIPRFCYHSQLNVAGNCRMCLVEIEKSPKPVASCAMPVTKNMKIFTRSPLVKKARESVLEFLLLNHPLDCPICDQGGECDLQEQALTFGSDKTRFFNFKRSVVDKKLGPIIKTVMTRCIHCTRCVRFMNDIAGTVIFGTVNRGKETELTVFSGKNIQHELSGNLVDVCPVGALTSKPFAFSSRPWELKSTNTIDFSDSSGSLVIIDCKEIDVLRIQPKQNDFINRIWLSNRGRFYFDSFKNNRLNKFFFKSVTNYKVINICSSDFVFILKKIIKLLFLKNSFINKINKNSKFYYSNFLTDFSIITNDFTSVENMFNLKSFYLSLGIKNVGDVFSKLSNFSNDLTKYNSCLVKIKLLPTINFCILIGTNPRFEISVFNIQLKKRFSFGLFNVISTSSFNKPSFPTNFIGISHLFLLKLVEGQTKFCKKMLIKTTAFFIGYSILNRFDKNILINTFALIEKTFHNKLIINFINTNVNSVGQFFVNLNGLNKQLLFKSKLVYLTNPQINKLKYIGGAFNNKSSIICYQSTHNLTTKKFKPDLAIPNIPIIYNKGHFISFNNKIQKSNAIKNATNNLHQNNILSIIKSLTQIYYCKIIEMQQNKSNQNKLKFRNLIYFLLTTYQFNKYQKNKIAKKFHFKNKIQYFYFIFKNSFKNIKIGRNPFTSVIYDFYATNNYSIFSNTLIKCSKLDRIKHINFY
jgi:NADH-quinone oxidoreductase chain G